MSKGIPLPKFRVCWYQRRKEKADSVLAIRHKQDDKQEINKK